jgi:hypothetical protein
VSSTPNLIKDFYILASSTSNTGSMSYIASITAANTVVGLKCTTTTGNISVSSSQVQSVRIT